MSRKLLFAVAFALACKPLPPRGPVPVEVAAGMPRLVLLPDDAQDRVILSATVAAGSAYDSLGGEGLAYLSARAAALPTAPDSLRVQVTVGKERVRYEVSCPPAEEARCAARLTEVLTHPRLDDVTRWAARDAASFALVGLPLRQDRVAADVLERWIFQAHPYGHRVEGRTGTLPLLSAPVVTRFFTRHVVRASTVIGVSGPASGAQVEALMEGLRALPTTLPPELVLMQPEPVTGRSLLVVDDGGATAGLAIGAPLKGPLDDADTAALWVALRVLAARGEPGARSGAVDGLPLGTDAIDGVGLEPRQQSSWVIRTRPVATADGVEAVRGVLSDLDGLARDGVTPAELDDARAALRGILQARRDDPGATLDAATDALLSGSNDPLRTLPSVLDGLTVERVSAVVQAHLHPNALRLVVVTGGAQAFADALRASGAPGTGRSAVVDEVFVRSAADLER